MLRGHGDHNFLPLDNSRDVAPGEALPGEPNMIGDALVGWRVKEGDNRQFGVPEMTHVNLRGLRNPEISFDPNGEHRILIVGDSSIYGVRARDKENILGQLQRILNKREDGWRVLNGGCPGYSSWQAIRLLEERLLDYQPEWLIVATLWSDTQGADAPDATRYGNVPMAWKYHSRLYMVSQVWYNKWKYTPADAPDVGFGLDQFWHRPIVFHCQITVATFTRSYRWLRRKTLKSHFYYFQGFTILSMVLPVTFVRGIAM